MTTNTRVIAHVSNSGNLRDPTRPWCLQWQTPTMPAPAFWYFETEERARDAETRLHAPAVRRKDQI